MDLAGARSAGPVAERRAVPGWLDLASCGSICCSTSCGSSHPRAQLGDQPRDIGCLAGPWPRHGASCLARVARSGCPGRSGWLALDAQGVPGSPWLANDCSIDTISKKKNRFAYRRSCFDAACFVRSGTFLHASNLVSNILQTFCTICQSSLQQTNP